MDHFDLSPFGSCLAHLLRFKASNITYTDLSERILERHADSWKSTPSSSSITTWLNYQVPLGTNNTNQTTTSIYKYLIKAACTIFLFVEPRNIHLVDNFEKNQSESMYLWTYTVLSNPNKEDIAIFIDIDKLSSSSINNKTLNGGSAANQIPQKSSYIFTRQTIRMFQVYLNVTNQRSFLRLASNYNNNIPAEWNFICPLCSNGTFKRISSKAMMNNVDVYNYTSEWKEGLFAFTTNRFLNTNCGLVEAWAWGKMKNCSMEDTLGTTMFSLLNISIAQKIYYADSTKIDSKCIGFWRYKQNIASFLHGRSQLADQDYTPEHFRSVEYQLVFCERRKENTAIISSWFAAYHLVIWLLMMLFAIVIVAQRAFQKHTKPDMIVDLWEVLCKNILSVVSVLFGKKSFETTGMFILLQLCMLVLLTAYRNYVYRELIKTSHEKPENSLSDLISSGYKIVYTGAFPMTASNATTVTISTLDNLEGRIRLLHALNKHLKSHRHENLTFRDAFTKHLEFIPDFPDGISEFDDILKHIADYSNNASSATEGEGEGNEELLKRAYFADTYPSSETMLKRLEQITGKDYGCYRNDRNKESLGDGVTFHMHYHALKDEIIHKMLHFKESGWTEFIAKSIEYTDHLIFIRKYYKELFSGNLRLGFNPKANGRGGRQYGFLKPLCAIYGTLFVLGCFILFTEGIMFKANSPAYRIKIKFKIQSIKNRNNSRLPKMVPISSRKELVRNRNPDKNRPLFEMR